MKKFINFVVWPAIAGLVFSIMLLLVPRVASLIPSVAIYLPSNFERQVSPPTQVAALSFQDAIKKAVPAVVSITNLQDIYTVEEYESENPLIPPSSRRIWNKNNSRGSGVIISPDGYIITSYHLFFTPDTGRLGEDITISLSDGRTMAARPVSLDETNDLALLKVNAEDLPSIGFNSNPQTNLQVGDIALAIGNPRNIGQSASMGIISAFLGKENNYLIQTDAAVNPGNSGGALIDIKGNLIGINSTIISESGGSEGIGLAIPAYKAMELLQTYIENEPSGYLGVDSEAITVIEGMRRYNEVVQGLLVNKITKNSPAEIAGIQEGDLIIAVNNERFTVRNEGDFLPTISAIVDYGPNQTVTLEIFRNGETVYLPVTLGVGEPIPYLLPLLDGEELGSIPPMEGSTLNN